MNVNGITRAEPTANLNPSTSRAPEASPVKEDKDHSVKESSGVVYEKSSESKETKTGNLSHAEVVQQMKADAEARTEQFRSLVEKIISKQSAAIKEPSSIYSYLATGDFTVDEATKLKAQEDISENGYWGAGQTSDRIVDFAIALAGGDTSKAEMLKNAFIDGYKQAEETWGGELPEVSQKTYDLVLQKLDQWSET